METSHSIPATGAADKISSVVWSLSRMEMIRSVVTSGLWSVRTRNWTSWLMMMRMMTGGRRISDIKSSNFIYFVTMTAELEH